MSLFISSDTNIWIDFFEIHHLEHPFLLEHKYYLSSAAYHDELIKSEELRTTLVQLGLNRASITEDEFLMAKGFMTAYRRLSLYDCIALAIAKARSWTLLSGDKPLRKAAECEGVECHGIIWIYDELLHQAKISKTEYHEVLLSLRISVQNGRCRLPIEELDYRLELL